MSQTVIKTPGVLPYEPFGFTNCARWGDTLYLSGIAALTADGQVVWPDDIEAQTGGAVHRRCRALSGAELRAQC
jgi:hypothetical protein